MAAPVFSVTVRCIVNNYPLLYILQGFFPQFGIEEFSGTAAKFFVFCRVLFLQNAQDGKDLNTLWDEYVATEMAMLPSGVEQPGEVSPLLKAVSLREAVNERFAASRTYLKV